MLVQQSPKIASPEQEKKQPADTRKWLYASGGRTRLVNSLEEQMKLGDGWYESPADVPEEPAPQAHSTGYAKGAIAMMEQVAELVRKYYVAPVGLIAQQVRAMTSLEDVTDMIATEHRRPNGPRPGVIKALTEREEELSKGA